MHRAVHRRRTWGLAGFSKLLQHVGIGGGRHDLLPWPWPRRPFMPLAGSSQHEVGPKAPQQALAVPATWTPAWGKDELVGAGQRR